MLKKKLLGLFLLFCIQMSSLYNSHCLWWIPKPHIVWRRALCMPQYCACISLNWFYTFSLELNICKHFRWNQRHIDYARQTLPEQLSHTLKSFFRIFPHMSLICPSHKKRSSSFSGILVHTQLVTIFYLILMQQLYRNLRNCLI